MCVGGEEGCGWTDGYLQLFDMCLEFCDLFSGLVVRPHRHAMLLTLTYTTHTHG